MKNTFCIKGDICFAPECGRLECYENSYIVVSDGIVKGIFDKLPETFSNLELKDFTGKLIIPGFTDLHLHAPQYAFRGMGMDLELLEWLDNITFPKEAAYNEPDFTKKAYDIFVQDIKRSATTRACIFGTIHRHATTYLMEALDRAAIGAYVGKVNMDRNSPDYYIEETKASISDTIDWIEDTKDRFKRVKPIITPRFVPSCTPELMQELGVMATKYNLPVQSHLCENVSEVEWVRELEPQAASYADAYDRYGLFGQTPTIMAHCIYLSDEELSLIKKNGVFIAHAPESNANLKSGIAPVRRFISENIRMGLSSDLAAGSSINMFKAVVKAIQVSKLRWRLVDESLQPLTFAEAFYLATKGGGSFFGKVGSFEEGYEFDALVVDDSRAATPLRLNVAERAERSMYLGHAEYIKAKFISGEEINIKG